MKRLYITVGLPGSGKSHWAEAQGVPVVRPDAIRLAMHGHDFIASAEPFVWAVAKTMVASLFLAGHNNVILDATNTTRKRRDEWQSDDYQRVFVLLDTPIDVCGERRANSSEGVKQALLRMASQFEPIGDDETCERVVRIGYFGDGPVPLII